VQTGMQTIDTVVWLRCAAIAAVTMGALWWPLQSVAHADQQSTRQRRQQPPTAANAWAGTPFEARCACPRGAADPRRRQGARPLRRHACE
jgi:hypothetical protein